MKHASRAIAGVDVAVGAPAKRRIVIITNRKTNCMFSAKQFNQSSARDDVVNIPLQQPQSTKRSGALSVAINEQRTTPIRACRNHRALARARNSDMAAMTEQRRKAKPPRQ